MPKELAGVQAALQGQAGRISRGVPVAAGGELILARNLLPLFYQSRAYQPAWIQEGRPAPQIKSLIRALKMADSESLVSMDYHLSKIEEITQEAERMVKKNRLLPDAALAELELLSSDAFLTYATHLRRGKVNFETLAVAWEGFCVDEALVQILESALAADSIEETLGGLPPRHAFYFNLKKALASYWGLAKTDAWEPLPDRLTLKKGDKGKAVKLLCRRLSIFGDLGEEKKKVKDVFDDSLEAALRRFQGRHGLETSGVLDQPTLAALNVPAEERIRQLELNLERWRWMPHDLGGRFIYINIANFELQAYEKLRKVLTMKVVAGNAAWQTPDFSSQMTHLIVNPYWTIPIPVILKETVNFILQDPCYLSSNKMVILRGWGKEEKEIDPGSIDWAKLNEKNLNFRIRQDPGPLNVLGRLKFVFLNKYDVFLHDTPYQEDFSKTIRAFSHGCVRAEKPVELAAYVLRGKPRWDIRRILAAIEQGVEQTVKLVDPIDVYFLYGTAWQDKDGTVEFRPDVYERDKKLAEALNQKPPLF